MKKTSKKDRIAKAEVALEVSHLSKSFRLPTESSNGIKQAFINWTKGIKGYKVQHVLNDISFTVEKGDFYGIVGRNGSGKSTLLKLISGIYSPDKGTIKVNGKLVPFIELGVGFNPELTGRENVYLNGAMLGFSVKEIDNMYDDIVAFAELEEFMDQKLKNYSSGMQVRLAFSVAIKAQGDILVLDEVLAVGDEAFQRKCYNYFAKLKRDNKTVILVTHSMESVQRFCNKAMLINDGEIELAGNPAKVAQLYTDLNNSSVKTESDGKPVDTNEGILCDVDYNIGDKINFKVNLESKIAINDAAIAVIIRRDTGEWVYRYASDESMKEKIKLKPGEKKTLAISLQNIFAAGVYEVSVFIKSRDRSHEYAKIDDVAEFEIVRTGYDTLWKPEEIVKYE